MSELTTPVEHATEWLAAPFGTISDLKVLYRKARIMIGVLAITLCPVVVLIDRWFGVEDEMRGSVSAYYYGAGGDWFVGALFAIGFLLLAYQYSPEAPDMRSDNLLSSFAALCAITIALAPTEGATDLLHGVAAALLFAVFAVFSLYQFTKTSAESQRREYLTVVDRALRIFRTDWAWVSEQASLESAVQLPTARKRLRNGLYRVLGWVIVAALIVAVSTRGDTDSVSFFYAEVVAVTAFSISWLIKGEAFGFLNDQQAI